MKKQAVEPVETGEANPENVPLVGTKEYFYDKLPVTKRMMDVICGLLIAAIVVALAYGIYLGNL